MIFRHFNKRAFILFLIGGVCFGMFGCDQRRLSSTERRDYSSISKGISGSASLTLYEGLPHQGWEEDQHRKELETKKVIVLHGFPFYERPLRVDSADIEVLRRLAAAKGGFSTYMGPKLCGGYHPDYCLVWNDGGTRYEFLICFGCHEMKLFGPQQEMLLDIRADAFKQFETTLKKYRDQRPDPNEPKA